MARRRSRLWRVCPHQPNTWTPICAAPFISNQGKHHLISSIKDLLISLLSGRKETKRRRDFDLMAVLQLSPTSIGFGFTKSSVVAALDSHRSVSQQSSRSSVGFSSGHRKKWRRVLCMKNGDRTPPTADASPLVKLAWYGSEAFGNAVSIFRPKSVESQAADDGELKFDGPVDRGTVVDLIKKDYDRSYFVTGNMATGIYEEECEFADPFVSFKGLNRFKQNVGNLGSFMEESTLKLTDWQEYEDRIYARWRFNCVLALPWRPILAATGSTEYFFSMDSGKISKHVETWDISPADGVRQLFKPNPRPKAGRK